VVKMEILINKKEVNKIEINKLSKGGYEMIIFYQDGSNEILNLKGV